MHACIDLGSNSFHLLIGEWKKDRIAIVEGLVRKYSWEKTSVVLAISLSKPTKEVWHACIASSCL